MVQTITDENYTKGTEQKTGVLFVDVDLVSFLNRDGNIVVYLKIGEVVDVFDEVLQDTITTYPLLDARTITYSQDEIKTLIEATARDFNDPVTNLLLDEINTFVEDIILSDITANASKYFGLTVDKWQKVA